MITDLQMDALVHRSAEIKLATEKFQAKNSETLKDMFGDERWNQKVEKAAKDLYEECLKTMKMINEIYGK